MDETAIARAAVGKRGYVLTRPGDYGASASERFSSAESRGHCTLVAVVAAEPAMQRHCRQLVLTRDDNLDRATKHALRNMEAPMQWLQGTSGWTNARNVCAVLTHIRRPFAVHFPRRPIVLFMDSASQHAAWKVLAHANRLRMQLVFIPGSLTWLLQPLDTHAFSLLKRRMVLLQQQTRATAPHGRMTSTAWISILQQAVIDVLQARDWSHAFTGNGLLGADRPLRAAVTQGLGMFQPLRPGCPTEQELVSVLGRHRVNVSVAFLSEARRVMRERQARASGEAGAGGGVSAGAVAPAVASAAGPSPALAVDLDTASSSAPAPPDRGSGPPVGRRFGLPMTSRPR